MNTMVMPPEGIVVHRMDNQIRIIRKWFDNQTIILMIWLVFWNFALVLLMWRSDTVCTESLRNFRQPM
jgi:hypothetical protein